MKEHPDYKYRPRRKPKTLVKSPVPTSNQSSKESPVSQSKYPFQHSLELSLGIPTRPPSFPMPHYPTLDPTLALDLQARLQAMYAGSLYHPWRYFGCSPITASQEPQQPPSPTSYVCVKPPKTSPIQTQTTTNIIWPTPLRYSAEHTVWMRMPPHHVMVTNVISNYNFFVFVFSLRVRLSWDRMSWKLYWYERSPAILRGARNFKYL